jgi:aspartyl-tRNA(Asn)/glutamyl-tRNA(Gln) amidotransferase subunit A
VQKGKGLFLPEIGNKNMDYYTTNYNIDIPDGAECAVLEDSIMHKGRPASAGSKMLENFISPLDATVVTSLEAAGIIIVGKTKMDEFGIAGLFADELPETSGAVAAVAGGAAAFALCNDYTGAVGQQAAKSGLFYIHPTYGSVSRYGLVPAAASMDQIGIVCRNPADGFRLLRIIAGNDPKDGVMAASPVNAECGTQNAELIVGIPANTAGKAHDRSGLKAAFGSARIFEFELKYFEAYAHVMRILCCAEISGNISRYDGIKYGHRSNSFADLRELYTKSRTEGFGRDAKLAAVTGAMVLSEENYHRYYDKAMRVRRLIRDSLEFDKYDVILFSSTEAAPEWRLELHALPRLCGLPSITAPFGAGWISLVADANREDMLISALEAMGI